MLTNRSTTPFPLLITKAGRWTSEMLDPGIKRTIAGDDVTNLTLGKQIPGTPPADVDGPKAKTNYINGIYAMEGRSDVSVPARVTPLRMFIENFEGTMDVNDGTSSIATILKGQRLEVTAAQFMLTSS
jgi:hypothetical protein